MNRLVMVMTAAVALVAPAQTQTQTRAVAAADKLAESRRAAIAEAMAAGFVAKPGEGKGRVAFIDAQKEVELAEKFGEVTLKMTRMTRLGVEYVRAQGLNAPEQLHKMHGADFSIVIVADDSANVTLVAPEERWARVNVRAAARGLKTDDARKLFLAGRCQRAALRAFAMLCGGASSMYPGNVVNCSRLEDADCVQGLLPVDLMQRCRKYLMDAGLEPRVIVPYKRACEEGWAPAPTNDVQKAIWDKIHQLPTEPMKIKPETKKVKE